MASSWRTWLLPLLLTPSLLVFSVSPAREMVEETKEKNGNEAAVVEGKYYGVGSGGFPNYGLGGGGYTPHSGCGGGHPHYGSGGRGGYPYDGSAWWWFALWLWMLPSWIIWWLPLLLEFGRDPQPRIPG